MLICSFQAAISQYYNLTFRNFTSSNGLSQSEVETVTEDKYGFIWIGTRFGLTRYDGKEFRTFYHRINDPASMGENIVTGIRTDSKGELWLTLYNSGLSRMNSLNFTFTNYHAEPGKNSLLSEKVNVLEIDRLDRVWVGTESGLSVFDPKTGKFTNITTLPGNAVNGFWVSAIKMDSLGNLWIGTKDHGIFKTTNDQLTLQVVEPGFKPGSINDIDFDTTGQVWIATDAGPNILFESTEENKYIQTKPPIAIQNLVIKAMQIDSRGNIWMATKSNGLRIFFTKEGFLERLQENFASSRGLLSNRLTCIYQDSRGGIWIGGENGLQNFYNDAQKFNIYPGLSNVSEELRGASIYGIFEVDNDFLMATSGGIVIYNRITNHFVPVRKSKEIENTAIRYRSFSREADDKWWVSSDHGMFELTRHGSYFELKRPKELAGKVEFKQQSFRSYVRSGPDIFWFATTNDGLLKFNKSTAEIKWFRHKDGDPASIADEVINVLTTDRSENLLIGHDAGFSVFDKNNETFKNYPDIKKDPVNGISNRYVYDLYDDGKKIWVATYGGGLNEVDKETGKVNYFTSANGLCNDAIYNIVPVGDSELWLSTNKGLSRFDITKRTFVNYNQDDGLPADEFNMLSKFVNSDGEIFMATINGVVSFFPDQLSQSHFQPKIYLAKIRLNGKLLSDSVTGIVNRDRNLTTKFNEDVYLEFSPLTYTGNRQLSIKYQLGNGSDWKEAQVGTLLPLLRTEPGSYQLKVVMTDNQKQESNSEIWSLNLVVLPPYYKTVSFRISLIVLGLLLSFYIIRTYIQRRLEKQRIVFEKEQAVEKERSRISAELHDDIGGGLTAIRLLSEMNKDKSQDETSRAFFGKISASSNELIQKMNEIVWALNVNHDNLQSLIAYTRQYAVSYLDDFEIRCDVKLPEDIPDLPVTGNKRRNVFLLVKEALNNIAKHAQATTVHVLISISEKLHIEISDNGRGVDLTQLKAGSHGLSNMRKRVDNLNGWLSIVNKNGTTVVIDIPLKDLTDISGT